MNTRNLLVSVLILVCLILLACAPAMPTLAPATITPTTLPAPTATPSSLDLLTGRYGNKFKITLDLLPDGSFYHEESTWGSYGSYQLNQNQISFIEENSNNLCYQHPAGVYEWSLNNGELKLEQVNDDCRQRSGYFGQIFSKMAEQKPFVSIARLTTVKDPGYIATDQQGNIYITNRLGFSKYDSSSKLIQTWSLQNITDKNTYATGIAVDSEGNIYIGNWLDAEIQKYNSNGNFLTSWKVDSGNIGPAGIGFDAQGNLYVALHRIHDHYVEKYDTQGVLLGTWAPFGTVEGQILGGPRSGPDEIAVDVNGNTYVTDPGNGRVNKYDANGKFMFSITREGGVKFAFPRVVVDSQKNAYIIDLNTIWKFDGSGKLIGEWFTPVGGAMAIDKDGNIIIAGNPISKVILPEQ